MVKDDVEKQIDEETRSLQKVNRMTQKLLLDAQQGIIKIEFSVTHAKAIEIIKFVEKLVEI